MLTVEHQPPVEASPAAEGGASGAVAQSRPSFQSLAKAALESTAEMIEVKRKAKRTRRREPDLFFSFVDLLYGSDQPVCESPRHLRHSSQRRFAVRVEAEDHAAVAARHRERSHSRSVSSSKVKEEERKTISRN